MTYRGQTSPPGLRAWGQEAGRRDRKNRRLRESRAGVRGPRDEAWVEARGVVGSLYSVLLTTFPAMALKAAADWGGMVDCVAIAITRVARKEAQRLAPCPGCGAVTDPRTGVAQHAPECRA